MFSTKYTQKQLERCYLTKVLRWGLYNIVRAHINCSVI